MLHETNRKFPQYSLITTQYLVITWKLVMSPSLTVLIKSCM